MIAELMADFAQCPPIYWHAMAACILVLGAMALACGRLPNERR